MTSRHIGRGDGGIIIGHAKLGGVRQIIGVDIKWFYTFKCYVPIRRPCQSHVGWELCLVPHAGRAWIPQVDVLLGVLAIKPNLMCHLTQVGWARHTCVPITNVKTARVARIPIGISFDDIGIWGLDIVLCSWGHAGMTGGHSIPTCRTVSSIHCRGGTVRERTAGITTLKSSWGTMRCAQHGATNVAHGGRKTALGKTPTVGDSTNVCWQAMTMALHVAATTSTAITTVPNVSTTAGIACIERQSVHAVDELVEGPMCCILDSR